MALTFDFANIKDQTLVNHPHLGEEEWHPVGYQLAQLSIPCGFRDITPENVDEVAMRVLAFQAVCGPVLGRRRPTSDKSAVFITRADVCAYMGMTTNAGWKSSSAFLTDLGEVAMQQGTRLSNEGRLDLSGDFVPSTAIDIFAAK